jgi:hypothetical protein
MAKDDRSLNQSSESRDEGTEDEGWVKDQRDTSALDSTLRMRPLGVI